MVAMTACAGQRPRTAQTPQSTQDRLERDCVIAREDAMRALWLGTMFSLSDPIMVGLGPMLGAPAVPRPCADARRDSTRIR